MKEVRVRIAPSPTGNFHVGTARNALYNYIFAKQNEGKFILRIDDTDFKRNSKEAEEGIYEGLKWLGLYWDEGPDIGGPYGPYRQSERLDIYQKYVDYLIEKGYAYYCFCSEEDLEKERKEQIANKKAPKYSGKCRSLSKEEVNKKLNKGLKPVVRFKVPDRIITFNDGVRGRLQWDGSLIGDFVIRKSDGLPTYNFATAIDDWQMRISHVLRSQEHIPNTFLQVLILEALGCEIPEYVHLPLLLNEDKSKISKRDGALFIGEYRDMGYLKEAVLNFIALLGWNPKDGEEILSIEDMIDKFSFERINNSNIVFDFKKLDWFNGVYIRKKSVEELVLLVLPFLRTTDYFVENEENYNKLVKIIKVEQERLKRLDEVKDSFKMFFKEPEYDANLIMENVKVDLKEMIYLLDESIKELEVQNEWNAQELEKVMRAFCDRIGVKTKILFMLLRIAETGSKISPPLFDTFEIIGKESTLKRLTSCKNYLETIL
ncbi:nondiscriminating glutamyl-tRNA synthetase [Caloramator fervidus]|uniref:Glutamate--tRNA ligase n=1 Tax=Caloramator fervidus TaxID=29344 RepID=A0A1H5SN83_9CLOT|nr:glutamate--tRNA ligase [Caloramator fervidus]SEF51281.1 nondiscriminating glutamyl-tRNA synthetase [Caloramator fervidus]